MRSRWFILALLCVLASLLAPATASANSSSGAKNRVWGFSLQEQTHVGGANALTSNLHPGCELAEYDFASGSPLAARGGVRPGSLSNEATRAWYKARLGEIPSRLDQSRRGATSL